MLPRMLLGVICVALLTNGVHAQTTRMSAEEKIKELQQQMLDMQSKMQEQMTTNAERNGSAQDATATRA